ncbi:MAG: DUF4097 family beta strand repeat-containing protein, partial [Pyrinomonadaceae bacterium]
MNRTAVASWLILLLSVTPTPVVSAGLADASTRQVLLRQDSPQDEPAIERDESSGRVSIKAPRNVKVTVDNRTTGRISVTGWDRDTIEARAMSEQGVEYVRASVGTDSSGLNVFLKADYAEESESAARREETLLPDLESLASLKALITGRQGEGREVHLEVKVPRDAEIGLIKVYRSEVEVTGVGTHIVVSGKQSLIKLSRVGAVEIRTASGPVELEEVGGLIDVVTTSGPVRVKNAGGDVRLLSISGDVEVRCARGRVNVGNANGRVDLLGVGGDVDVTTAGGEIRFAGAIHKDGTYRLKSMSGPVEMSVGPEPAGFTAVLSSYRGAVDT